MQRRLDNAGRNDNVNNYCVVNIKFVKVRMDTS